MLAARSELSEATTVSELVRMNEHTRGAAGTGMEDGERASSTKVPRTGGRGSRKTRKKEGEGGQGEGPGEQGAAGSRER